MKQIAVAFLLVALFMAARLPGMTVVSAAGVPSWDLKRAATYMDARAVLALTSVP